MIWLMNINAIVFAVAKPAPEIWPDAAQKAGGVVAGTGRRDFPHRNLVFSYLRVYSAVRSMPVGQGFLMK